MIKTARLVVLVLVMSGFLPGASWGLAPAGWLGLAPAGWLGLAPAGWLGLAPAGSSSLAPAGWLALVPAAMAQTAPAAASSSPATDPALEPGTPMAEASTHIGQMAASLADIEKTLKTAKPSLAELDEMRQTVRPIMTQSQTIIDRLAPVIAALKARVDQLGPKPAANAPPEAPEVTKARTDAQAAYDAANGILKRANLLATEAQQDDGFLSASQRAAFNRGLFQRDTSILYPPLWFTVISETPGNMSRAMDLGANWIKGFAANLGGLKVFVFVGGVIILVFAYVPLHWVAAWILRRDPKIENPSRWRKVLAACWVSLSVPAVIIVLMYGLAFLCASFAVPDTRLQPLFAAVQDGIIRIAVGVGLANGILSPGKAKWRLPELDDETCRKLMRSVIGIAVILSGARIIESINDVIYASISFSIVTRGLGALLVAAAMSVALYSLGGEPGEDATPPAEAPAAPHELSGLVRGVAWTVVIIILAAVLTGYSSFGHFLVEQIVLVSVTGAILWLAVALADEACAAGFHPNSLIGRSLIYSIGLRREGLDQVAILLSGLVRLVLIVIAVLVVMVPWGLQSTDIPSNLYAIFFGFKVGDVTVSLAGIALAFLIFVAIIAATRGVQGWLENRYLPLTRLDSGLQNSIKTSLGYAGFLLALTASAADLGVDFQKLAIVAGALSVGIGFGLQSIVNNFVSGLILLWERAVRVGDWIVVGADQGYVRKINVRSTEIETFDRASVIVPNSNLVSGIVKNLMRTDRVGRLMIELIVNPTADPEKVRETLLEIARAQDGVLSMPSPQVRFTNLTASAMNFDLYCFIADVETLLRTKSDLYFAIHKEFNAKGYFNGPAPDPLAVKIEDLDKFGSMLQSGRNSHSESPTRVA